MRAIEQLEREGLVEAGLRIADGIAPLPFDAVTSTFAILAIRGAGKSYLASVFAEELSAAGLRFVAHDPTGAWWGIRASADGDGPGFPVVIFGGDHGDLPLHENAGVAIADLVAGGEFSCVLDTSHFETKASVAHFMLAFCRRLYHCNRSPLHVILDEADAIAPQQQREKGGELPALLGAVETLVRRGRIRGLGVTLVTQRAAVLNKNVLSQIETLLVLRTTSPHDRKAIDEWVSANGTDEEREKVFASLASLKNGEAWIWSPTFLRLLARVQIRKRRTFDSGATPKVGERRQEPKALTPVDVAAIRTALESVVEMVEREDPKALQRRIDELEAELAQARSEPAPATAAPVVRAVPVFPPEDIARLEAVYNGLRDELVDARLAIDRLAQGARETLERIRSSPAPTWFDAEIETPAPARRRESTPAPRPAPNAKSNGAVQLRRGAREMLRSLASMRARPLSRQQIATLSGLAPSSGTFSTYLGDLKNAGYIIAEGASQIAITAAGIAAAGDVPRPSSTSELRALWGSKLRAGARRMLDELVNSYPKGMSRDELARRTSMTPESGTFSTYLGNLTGNGLAEKRGRELFASSSLFLGRRA